MRWSLRRRLVVAVVVLLATVSTSVGVASVVGLRSTLMQRLDQQLLSELRYMSSPEVLAELGATSASISSAPGGSRTENPSPVGDTMTLVFDDEGVLFEQYITKNRVPIRLTAQQKAHLLSVAPTRTPESITIAGHGDYRAAAVTAGATTAVVALPQGDVESTTSALAFTVVLIALTALLVAGIAGVAVVTLSLRPLKRIAATATRVSELPLHTGEVALAERVPDADTDTRTEVGQVASALNRLLGHVEGALVARQASEDKVRQFVADASHELRTPLASIRGYSELTRRGGHDLPEDVVRSLARIESESIRMTSLVEDLLLLARLDEGRELVLSSVDVTAILVDAVSDAHAASPEHVWQVNVPDSPVLVLGDAGRLHQVVANLLANARIHTPTGTTVTAEVEAVGGHAVITVTDDGPGIPDAVKPVLFERFARGDGSRSRATGSTGLGLAIVAAVVDAHRGTVEVESSPGRTRFAVRIPLAP